MSSFCNFDIMDQQNQLSFVTVLSFSGDKTLYFMMYIIMFNYVAMLLSSETEQSSGVKAYYWPDLLAMIW